MPRTTLESALAKRLEDNVFTRAELASFGNLAVVKQAPGPALTALDAYAPKMTASTFDAFNAAKTQLATAPSGVSALDVLTGKVRVEPSLPSWYPASFDLAVAAVAVKDVLIAQGERAETIAPGQADKLLFTDADLTMLKTSTPTLLKHKVTGEYLRYPDSGRLVLLGIGPHRGGKADFEAIKAQFPAIDWDSYGFDFSEFGSLTELLRTPMIPDDLRALRRSDRDPQSRDFVVTSRSSENIPLFMDAVLSAHGIDINGVLAVGTPSLTSKLGMGDPALTSARKKALTMAAIITAYGGAESLKEVKFLDDTDENLIAAMQLLPKLFPTIKFSFYDVLNEDGSDKFKHHLIARTTLSGELVDGRNKRISVEAIDGYKSNDQYPLDPIFQPFRR